MNQSSRGTLLSLHYQILFIGTFMLFGNALRRVPLSVASICQRSKGPSTMEIHPTGSKFFIQILDLPACQEKNLAKGRVSQDPYGMLGPLTPTPKHYFPASQNLARLQFPFVSFLLLVGNEAKSLAEKHKLGHSGTHVLKERKPFQ